MNFFYLNLLILFFTLSYLFIYLFAYNPSKTQGIW